MRAAVIQQHGGPGSIAVENDFPDPTPAAQDVVVRIGATSLNYHDIFTRRGMPGIKVPMPCIMGLDFAGEIVEVGPEVGDWRVGQRVLIDPMDRVGPGGLIGEMWHGGLAEYCKVPSHHLVALPDEVSFEDAACLPVAYGTALRMMYTVGEVRKGDRVLILGASGGVGTCCVRLAKARGCEVIACASSADKLARLAEIGADHGINYVEEEFHKWVFKNFGKPHRRRYEDGVDVVVNFTGGDTWVPSLKVLHRGGKLLTCGATAGFDPKEDLRYIWSYELKVMGAN
ncbi:MAG: zinc-binding dehydrogenase, partial [Alphaproteobacteria bacterium]|nr:zinc-binding dehydrogenase [Alphaproteobacteria bacterium]